MFADTTAHVFRQMLESGETFVQPGVFNAQSAQIAEQAGFKTVGLSGYGISATLLGKPDVGLTTLSEVAQVTGYVCDAVSIPVLADADTGYGNAINAMRTVEQLIKAGAAGMFIEDQVSPKRCGFMAGKEIIAMDEAVGKLRAAVRVRNEMNPQTLLIARSDARGTLDGSIEDTIERGKAFLDAGVDVYFPEGIRSTGELEQVARALDAPLLFNRALPFPGVTLDDLNELGVFLVVNPGGVLRSAIRGMWDYLHGFAAEDQAWDDKVDDEMIGHPGRNIHEFVGFDAIRALEEEFLPESDLDKKYGR